MRSGTAVVLSDYVGGEGAASGGAGHAALDSYRALAAAGADVRLLTGFGDVPQGEATLGGRDLRAAGMAGSVRSLYNVEAERRLAGALAGMDRDTTVVILHQWTRYLSPSALRVAGRFPLMIYSHDYFWPCPNGAYYDFTEARPCERRPMGARCLIADCDRQGRLHKAGRVVRQAARELVTRGPVERRLFLHMSERAQAVSGPLLPGERHAVLYNPLSLPAAPPPAPTPVHQIGYFGRMEAEKGVAQLLDAVEALELTALFVGEGSLAPRSSARVEHRAWQPRDHMAEAMRSCAVVVLPSLWDETWGLVVPEAMAAGVPVLVSSRAGSAELVGRFGGGATFDPGVPGALAQALAGLLAAPAAPTRAHDALRAFLSPERHATRIMTLAKSRFGIDLGERRLSAA